MNIVPRRFDREYYISLVLVTLLAIRHNEYLSGKGFVVAELRAHLRNKTEKFEAKFFLFFHTVSLLPMIFGNIIILYLVVVHLFGQLMTSRKL
jgi:hypothetical protein